MPYVKMVSLRWLNAYLSPFYENGIYLFVVFVLVFSVRLNANARIIIPIVLVVVPGSHKLRIGVCRLRAHNASPFLNWFLSILSA